MCKADPKVNTTLEEETKRNEHALLLIGAAAVHQCQLSAPSATKLRALLGEFYSSMPELLNLALHGLTLEVPKPGCDLEP